jgi:hypothetical protein
MYDPLIAQPLTPLLDTVSLPAATRLPAELIHQIIDYVVWDEGTVCPSIKRRAGRINLGACSLASKAWLPRSRHHLFCRVSLTARDHPLRFIELLRSPLATIAPYVRYLQLDGHSNIWLNKALRRLAILTAVETLLISANEFEKSNNVVITRFFSGFSKLKSLQLSYCSFSPCQLSVVLSATPHLEHLGLCFVRERSTFISIFSARLKNFVSPTMISGHSMPSRPVPNHLRKLNVVGGGFSAKIIRCVKIGNNISPIDTLQLLITNSDDINVHSELMRVLGPSLEDLKVDFGVCWGLASRKRGMLPSSAHLESFITEFSRHRP